MIDLWLYNLKLIIIFHSFLRIIDEAADLVALATAP